MKLLRDAIFGLRLLAYVKRIALALERIADAEEDRLMRDYPLIKEEERPARMAEISRPTVGDWNDRRAGRG